MSKKIILDASALLALLNNEPGNEKVEEILSVSVMSTVNVTEVVAELENKLNVEASQAKIMVTTLVKTIEDFTLEQAVIAGSLKKKHKNLGLSLGDRACLALSIELDASVYTTDRIWQKLNMDNKVILIR